LLKLSLDFFFSFWHSDLWRYSKFCGFNLHFRNITRFSEYLLQSIFLIYHSLFLYSDLWRYSKFCGFNLHFRNITRFSRIYIYIFFLQYFYFILNKIYKWSSKLLHQRKWSFTHNLERSVFFKQISWKKKEIIIYINLKIYLVYFGETRTIRRF